MLLDLAIALLIALMMYAGYVRGIIVSMAAIGCFGVGGLAGAIVGSFIGETGAPAGAMAGGVLAAMLFAVRLRDAQEYVHAATPAPLLRHGDRALGALLNGGIGVFLVWFAGAAMSLTPDASAQRMLHSSHIADVLVETVSPTGTTAARVLRSGIIPSMRGPIVLVDDPDDRLLQAPGVMRAAMSVVKVKGETCEAITTGTGWVIARGLVVTNAHVVAGHQRTVVEIGGTPPGRRATVMAFDSHNDIAVLAVPGLELPPLQIAPHTGITHGTPAVIIGYPRRAGLTGTAARYDRTIEYETRDIYEQPAGRTRISVFRGVVRSGNSGSPLLDVHGRVIATVTAEAIGQSVHGGYAVPNDVTARVVQTATRPVSTGPCMEEPTEGGGRDAPPRPPVFELGR